jgi:alpha-glucosidase (family GH31 glycosyl hydrolase)
MMCLRRKLAAVLLVATLLTSYFLPDRTFAADASASVVRGNVRFQALSPSLVRMEYSPKSTFVDEASVAVVGRSDFSGVAPRISEKDGWLTLSTEKMAVSYKLGSGPFSKDNLRIAWSNKSGEHAWKPGDQDAKNLGGVPGTMDGRSMVAVTDPGPLSRNGYYWLDDSRTALFNKATDWVNPRSEKDSLDWYFFVYGNNFAGALTEMARLIGPIPMLPRYVFGLWFGSRAAYSDQQWQMIIDRFREERLPVDMIVLDSLSLCKVVWSGYDRDPEQMRDLRGFLAWMRQRGIKATINEHYEPLTRVSDSHFETIRQAMGMPENTEAIPHDISNKKYAALFMDLLHKPDLDKGMAFWWQDGFAGTQMEGLEPYMWTRHIEYLGSERITGKRTTAFCRFGTAVGSHRYGIYFTGDLTGIWESLPVMIPATIRGGNQLMPYMNNLCCGVHVANLPPELYQRWVQLSAFHPVFWFHGIWGLRLPWEYGDAGMETYRKFVGLRYALLPYTYTCSRIAHDTGLPLVRGMYLDYPNQEQAFASNQQYLFGRELLVAPVTKPGGGKPVDTDVFLPAGDNWFDYFTGDIYQGGRKIVHRCPLDRMPLFARAGSIIPTGPKMDYSDQKPVDPLTLDVYAGKRPAQFKLYEDDGVSLDYRKGAYAWTTVIFKPINASGNYALTIGPAHGRFAGQLEKRRYLVRVHGLLKPKSVTVEQTKLDEVGDDQCGAGWTWDAQARTTTVRLPNAYPIDQPVVVVLQEAGTFADAVALQEARNLRDQIREAKRLMKLKNAELMGTDLEIKKPPRVILKTEEVERELTAVVERPSGIAGNPPDFQAMRQRVLSALTDRPFDSTRTIPDSEPHAIDATKKIENATFTPQEIAAITKLLRGADVPAWPHP